MISLGIDPGFAVLGWAAIELNDGVYTLRDMGCIRTKPTKEVLRHNIRKTDDDSRRIMDMSAELAPLMLLHTPDVIGIETFSLRPKMGAGWKTAFGYAASLAVSRLHSVLVLTFTPGDVKLVTKDKTASKEKIRQVMTDEVFHGLDWSSRNKGDLEHLGDALALAYLASKQLEEYRRSFG